MTSRTAAAHVPILGSVAAWVGAVAALGACAARGPEVALHAYRDALQRRDAAQVRALSDARFRATYDDPEVAAALAGEGAWPSVRSIREEAEAELEDGRVIRLVREGDAWRVAEGGVEPPRFETPERALASFFRAVRARRLDVLREAMPGDARKALATDALLEAHLDAQAERIERARREVGPIEAGRVQVDGARAHLSYGQGLAVTFVLEGGLWRIVDIE